MKIYNEVTTIFNDITGKWETISEDSFEWNGPIDMTKVQEKKVQQKYDPALDYDSSGTIDDSDVAQDTNSTSGSEHGDIATPNAEVE